jgi:hypothetical protein
MANPGTSTTRSPNSSQTDVSEFSSIDGKRGTTWAANGLNSDSYRPVDTYEGIHRYDPDFEWEPEDEKKVVKKVGCFLQNIERYS